MNERVCLRIMKKGYYAAAKGAKEISYKPPWKVLICSYCQGKLASWQKYIVWVYFQKSKTNLYIPAAGTENLFSPKIFTPHFYYIVLYFVVVQSLSRVRLFATPWTAAHQVSLSFTISGVCSNSNPESVMMSNHLILCHPLLLLPPVFPSMRIFSNKLAVCIRWPKCWSFSISPSNEYSGLISFRTDWFDLLAVQRTVRSVF